MTYDLKKKLDNPNEKKIEQDEHNKPRTSLDECKLKLQELKGISFEIGFKVFDTNNLPTGPKRSFDQVEQ